MAFSIDVTDFTYSHLGQGDGLCSQRIYSILQTSDGALWWSTKNNVERYNGVSLFHYLPGDPAAYSDFAGKFIKLCDHCRNADGLTPTDSLFAFDNKGTIYRYNAVHDAFYPYADLRGMVEGYLELNDMLPTTEGVWLATRRGIFFLRDGRLTAVRSGVAANYIVRTRRSLLFCTREGVLLYEGPMQGVPQPQTAMRTVDGSDAESGYYDDRYDRVWLGGYSSGIRVLACDGGRVVRTDAVAAESGAVNNPVRAFCPYDDRTMLIGIDAASMPCCATAGATSSRAPTREASTSPAPWAAPPPSSAMSAATTSRCSTTA